MWHCVVGRNFGSFVTHDTKHFMYLSLGKVRQRPTVIPGTRTNSRLDDKRGGEREALALTWRGGHTIPLNALSDWRSKFRLYPLKRQAPPPRLQWLRRIPRQMQNIRLVRGKLGAV